MASKVEEEFEQPPLWVLIVMYYNYTCMYIFGYIADFLRAFNIGKPKVKITILSLQARAIFFRNWPKISSEMKASLLSTTSSPVSSPATFTCECEIASTCRFSPCPGILSTLWSANPMIKIGRITLRAKRRKRWTLGVTIILASLKIRASVLKWLRRRRRKWAVRSHHLGTIFWAERRSYERC